MLSAKRGMILINMSSTKYTKVACGVYRTGSGEVWSVQNFE